MMTMRARRIATYSIVFAALGCGWMAGCGGGDGASNFTGVGDDDGAALYDGGGVSDVTLIQGDDGGGIGSDAPNGHLVIAPASGVVSVTLDATGAHATPLAFTATLDGSLVTPTWSFDRGELGSIAGATGIFTASGKNAGIGTVTAHYGNAQATATVTVQIHSVQNGGPQGDAGAPDSGAGGAGGVGGEGAGGPVDSATVGRLRAGGGDAGTPASDLALLYPYDKTVWPRGILAPLVQWKTSHAVTAVYIHVTQKNFEFEGFYSGTALVHQPIDQTAWTQATNGNGGDPMHVAITIADGTNVWGPVSEDWIVAPGALKGTVYYNSYNTKLATPVGTEPQAAAVLAIKPGSSDPTLALPGTSKKCIVCHTLSDDGQTLWAQDGQLAQGQTTSWPDYNNGTAYDMKNGGAPMVSYTGNAPDGTTNDRKFLWSGPSPDGTFALQSSGHTQETYGANTPGTPNLDSRVFRRDNGSAVTATGLDGIVREAVTPAFSRDGKHVAFNFWSAKSGADAGIAQGNGHTLDLMDFACGGAGSGGTDGGTSCSTFAFSNLRRLYTNPSAKGYPAWPAWLPDGSGVVFHNTVDPGTDSPISTWHGSKAEQWFVDVPQSATATPQPVAMNALNGKDATGTSYLPANANHPNDTILNYEPTINPIASGGYYWVVFTSRRMYGNIASGDPYAVGNGTAPVTKKLWVAAIELHPTPGKDPSHPAFYLPGQEINAPNMRGFWVVDPCRPNGISCETGDECCNGFCREPGDGGALQCTDAPVGCANEFENCTLAADCCGASSGFQCLNGRCARPTPK